MWDKQRVKLQGSRRRAPVVVHWLLALGVAALLAGSPRWQAGALPGLAGSHEPKTGLKVIVRSGQDMPIPAAQVSLPELRLRNYTDSTGQVSWEDIPLEDPAIPVTITVSAPGYGSWTIAQVILAANDTLILTPELTTTPVTIRMAAPEARSSSHPLAGSFYLPGNRSITQTSFGSNRPPDKTTRGPADFTIPDTIRVRVTGKWECDPDAPYSVETVDFKQYVKHVLPNEWYSFWPREALKAGAVAVKMYAWYFIAQGGKWEDADVLDNTCDQWYVPFLERESTNQAVEDTWPWLMTRNGNLFPAYHKDIDACDPPNCIRQSVSANLARSGRTWDDILQHFYGDITLSLLSLPPAGFALRFHGLPEDGMEANRLVLRLNDLQNTGASFPANVGDRDFTIEWWMKSNAAENSAPPVACGPYPSWIYGNILLDRYRPDGKPGFGISLAGGAPAFGVTARSGRSLTICSNRPVTDGRWHHVAIQRREADGALWLFVDGQEVAYGDGPNGDLRYPDQEETAYPDREPFLSIGGWKMDPDHRRHPFFRGWIDELRISDVLRYSGLFEPLQVPFPADEFTRAIYHFDEGIGALTANAAETGSSPDAGKSGDGLLLYGGLRQGPEWVISNLFLPTTRTYLPAIRGQ